MKYCSNCGHEMQDDEMFCGECGTKIEEENIEPVFCPECGTKNQAEDSFCQNCGASLGAGDSPVADGQTTEAPLPEQADTQAASSAEQADTQTASSAGSLDGTNQNETEIFCSQCGSSNSSNDGFCQNCGASLKEEIAAVPSSEIQQPPKKKSKLPFLIGGAAVAAAALIAVAVGIGGSGKSSANNPTIFYYKDKGLYGYQLNNNKLTELTEKATSSRYEDMYMANRILYDTIKTKDGRYVFYFEKFDGMAGTLYYKDLKKQSEKNDTSVKVDSDVSSFQLTENNKLLYVKGSTNRNLYLYDLNAKDPAKEKLATDVAEFAISENEKDLIWVTSEYVLYHKELTGDSDKKKLDSNVFLEYYTKDLKTIYYTKNENAYCYKNLSDKEKIGSDIMIMSSYNDDSCILYGKSKDSKVNAADLVEDDMKDIDKDVEEPYLDDFKKRVTTTWGSRYETDYDAYEAAMEKYQAKADRDYIRNQLNSYESYNMPVYYDIYSYDGKESKELAKDVKALENMGRYSNPIYMGIQTDNKELPTILLSELESVYDIDDILYEYLEEQEDTKRKGYIFVDGKPIEFDYLNDAEYYGDPENKTIYYVTYDEEDAYSREYQELYSMKYTDKGMEAPVLLDDDLDENIEFSSYYINIEYNGLYYLKDYDYEEESGTLFCNGNKIDDDVFTFLTEEDKVYYLKDFTESNLSGTLMSYDGKNSTAIADDVTIFSIVDDYAAVLTDYNTRRDEGDLKLFSLNGKGKEKLIDEEVTFIKGGRGSSRIFDY